MKWHWTLLVCSSLLLCGCPQDTPKPATQEETPSLDSELAPRPKKPRKPKPPKSQTRREEKPIRPLPRPKVGMTKEDVLTKKFLSVLHRKNIYELIGFLGDLNYLYVLSTKKRQKGRPWLYHVLTEEKKRLVTLVAFTSEAFAESYRKALKRPHRWESLDFDVPTAVRILRAGRQYYIAEKGRRYYVEQIWINPLAGVKRFERRIPIGDLHKNPERFVRAFSKQTDKIWLLYRRSQRAKAIPYYGWDPYPPTERYLAIPVFVRKELAMYHWSHLGKKAHRLKVVKIDISELLDELEKMRRFWRRIRGRKYFLRKVWFNPHFPSIEFRISIRPLRIIRAMMKQHGAKKKN